jgi:serine phosphatase RsbU (regulator of sigma subunit)/integral membrane sensor domain MASE1/anti-sigma regulatory factor (Ser/Thr protein kinase)
MADGERTRSRWDDSTLPAIPDLARHIGRLALVGVAYYLGARLGLTLSLVERNVTPLWPPTGIAVAAFLLIGRSMWPGVALAAFAVNLPISDGALAAAVTAVGNTVAPLAAAALLHRVGFRRQLDRSRDALALVFAGALPSMMISAAVGTAVLLVTGLIQQEEVMATWAVWWTGDAMGVLVVAPFLLSLPLFREEPAWRPARWVEGVVLLVVATAMIAWASQASVQVLFLVLPVLAFAAWRLQLRGAAPAALITSLVASWSATRDGGPFSHGGLFEQMFTLQAFNACVALTSFVLSAMVSERNRVAEALAAAAAELEDRVELRTAELTAANTRLIREIRERSEAQAQLSQEEARTRREHQIAETLQRSLLPDRLPELPGVALAARYVPATADMQVGGDWYDVIHLPDGLVGLAIGDVAGHGLQAAATMGQVRMAVRAYALQDSAPVSVMSGAHQLVSQLASPTMVTLLYLLYDPENRHLRFTNAGHPPALVFDGNRSTYLGDGLSPPLGVTAEPDFTEVTHEMPPGATLLLYTDGLVERRGVSIQDGLDRLAVAAMSAAAADVDVDELCDGLLLHLVRDARFADDIALLAMRPLPLVAAPLILTLPGEARMLVQMRGTVRRWLRESGVSPADQNEILIACGEACSNVVRHAYGAAPGAMHLKADLMDDTVVIVVRDHGTWRPPADRGGGWGLQLIKGLMDTVDLDRGADGTIVRMQRRVRMGTPE